MPLFEEVLDVPKDPELEERNYLEQVLGRRLTIAEFDQIRRSKSPDELIEEFPAHFKRKPDGSVRLTQIPWDLKYILDQRQALGVLS